MFFFTEICTTIQNYKVGFIKNIKKHLLLEKAEKFTFPFNCSDNKSIFMERVILNFVLKFSLHEILLKVKNSKNIPRKFTLYNCLIK